MNIVQRLDRHPMWRGFVRSNYITALWNWFLGLAGKAAEPVLFGSVLYSGYELVPGVPQPTPGVNAVAFVIQQAALDVGGMGLIKLTKDEAPEKYRFARGIGIALITLMVINMVVATSGRVFTIPSQYMQVIEGILLIIRSIFAVLFGHAIHTLKSDSSDEEVSQSVEEIVSQTVLTEVQNIRSFYESKIADLEQSVSSLKSEILAVQERTSQENTEPIAVQEIMQSVEEVEQPQESVAPSAPASPPRVAKSTAPKVQSTEAMKKVQRLLKKQPNLTAKQIAERAEISESYAQKLKAQIAKEAARKEQPTDQLQASQSEQNTDPLPATNGHRRVTQPLALVEMEV